MSKPYFLEDDKKFLPRHPGWTWEEMNSMQHTLYKKGYEMNAGTRLGADLHQHNCWTVPRKQVPQLIEELFRQRLIVEAQAEGHRRASLIFTYDNSGEEIKEAVKKFRRYKKGGIE